jgi:uncharacterized protein (TIGR02466 family)
MTAAGHAAPRPVTVPLFATPIANHLWPDSEDLNRALADLLLQREHSEAGIARSNVGGWHSTTDLFGWDAPAIGELATRIGRYVTALFESVALDRQARAPAFRLEGWANVLRHGQYHSVHSHPNAFWSGVYYVNGNPAPDGDHPFSGKLELLDPRPGVGMNYVEGTRLYGRFLVNPSPGQMVVFPGWLQHQVHPYFGTGERLTIAFNVIVTD